MLSPTLRGNRVVAIRRSVMTLALLASACAASQVEPDILIDGATVIDGTGRAALPDHSVAIQGDRILAIGPAGRLKAGERTARIDGRGKYLIPGLWDMHVHLAGYGERAFPLFLANGVTTIREMGGNLTDLVRLREQIRAGRINGPELLIAGPILDSPWLVRAVQGTIYAEGREAVPDSAQGVFWVDSLHRAGVDQIKVHSMTPRSAYLAILARARQHGIPVTGHLPDSVLPREAIEAGQRTIEHHWRVAFATSNRSDELARWELERIQAALDAAGEQRRLGPSVMIRLAATDSAVASFDQPRATEFAAWAATREVWFDPTLVVIQAFLGIPNPGDSSELRYVPRDARMVETVSPYGPNPTAAQLDTLHRRYLTIRKPFDALMRGGAKFIAGTDVPVMPLVPGFALHRELGLLVEAGLTPMQALQAATMNAAQAAARFHETGTLEPGKRADLVLLDADPLTAITNTRRIHAVIARGRLLDRNALDRMLAEAEEYARAH